MSMSITPSGDSSAWNANKANVIRIFDDEFRNSTAVRATTYTNKFKESSEAIIVDTPVYEGFAYFLVQDQDFASERLLYKEG